MKAASTETADKMGPVPRGCSEDVTGNWPHAAVEATCLQWVLECMAGIRVSPVRMGHEAIPLRWCTYWC